MRRLFNKSSLGFTVVELIVTMTILTMLTPVVLFSLGNYYDSTISSLTDTTQDTDTHNAVTAIAKDLRAATGFRASLDVASITPLGSTSDATSNGAWSYCGSTTTSTVCDGNATNNFTTNRVLIAYTYASDGALTSNQRMPAFIKDASPSFNPATAQPATVANIYFVAKDRKNSSQYDLYRRTVVDVNATTDVFRNVSAATGLWPCSSSNPTYASCTMPYQKTSCASTMSSYSICGARDAVLMYDVKSFWVDYYDSSNAKIATYSNTAGGATTAASNIKNNTASIQITVSKKLSNLSKKTSVSTTRVIVQ